MIICGIDEAGRGPVIGPLVMAGVLIEESKVKLLDDIGVKDSKLIKKQDRESMFKQILSIVKDYKIISVTPDIIDKTLLDPMMNLNKLEAHTTSEIINYLKPEKAIIDLPDKDADRYCNYIRKKLKIDVNNELIAEHKADLNYTIVGAASILAKVTRDNYIEHLKEQFGEDFGSGYMSDAKTRKFLEKHWNNKDIYFFRKEWASWKNIKREKEQNKLSEFFG